jgi:Domain of unknown function (DUF6457)
MSKSNENATTISLARWLDRVRRSLPPGVDLGLSPAEEVALLDLARVAAHASERIAAPLSTFLAGVALGSLAPDQRAQRLADLVRELEGRG